MPEWMKRDAGKYPNITGRKGQPVDSPSPHTQAAMEADAKAFAAVMAHLEKVDPQYTVLMVQVQNEPGSWGSVCDYSATAQKLSEGQVPAELLKPEVLKALNRPVDAKGTWQEVFGNWSVMAIFNYTKASDQPLTTKLDAAKDLRLDPNKEYIVYEFWTRKLIGIFKGTFVTRPLNPYDCDIYSIVEKQNRPVLISTSRHIRQMAFDIKDLSYDNKQQTLKGISRAVTEDPCQLPIYAPEGFIAKRVELSEGIESTMKAEGNLLTVDYISPTGKDVEWKVFF